MVSVLIHNNPKHAKPFLGAVMILVSVLMWPMADALTKLLYSENALTLIFYVVFLRGAINYIMGTGLSKEEGQYIPLAKLPYHPDIKIGLVRGISGAMINIMLLIGLQYITITQSAAILFMAPFMVLILSPFVLGTPFKSGNLLTIGTAILGLLVVTNPKHATPEEFYYGFSCALLAAVFMTSFVLINFKYKKYNAYLAYRTSGLCYMGLALIGLILANVMGFTNAYVVDFTTFTQEQILIFIGAVALNAMGTYVGQEGFKYTPPVLASVIAYMELFWVLSIDHIVFGGIKESGAFAGLILIATAGVVSVYFNNSKDG